MIDLSFLTLLGLGFMLGLRHALDIDHVAAVSTVVARRPSFKASSLIGFSWGIGHTVILLLSGLLVLWFRVPVPGWLTWAAEGAVGMMLVVLGTLLALKLVEGRWHIHRHAHEGTEHIHLHSHAVQYGHGHSHWLRDSVRPLCIGMAHGLSGSAALLLLVVSSAHSTVEGMVYIAVFGVGSILGMILVGLALSLPVIWSFRISPPALFAVQGAASLGSVVLGLSLIYKTIMGSSIV